ncbi:MAG: PQQ-binding-like beta-propeller repeat protein [Pseudomonadales bacterium]|nr:PQQ-binding-like beta-propeller repeat protein [Pseudomonadales bacterium]
MNLFKALSATILGLFLPLAAWAQSPYPLCENQLNADFNILSSGWSRDVKQQQFYNKQQTGLDANDLPALEESWSFVFDDAVHPRSAPAITDLAVFIGSESGLVYALDTDTGCEYWRFQAEKEVRTAISIGKIDGRWAIFFGDQAANAYSVDAKTGQLIWKKSVHAHPYAVITGSPVLYSQQLFVPVSSMEVKQAINPFYPCCTFQGALVALDAKTGTVNWQFNTIEEANKASYRNVVYQQQYGPSGVAIWSAPTIDIKRQRIYIGTGQHYNAPATNSSDAIIALELHTGKKIWMQQTVSGDIWNPSCLVQILSANCPDGAGNDYDFGAPPILVTRADGKDVILAGQKSGMLYVMDADRQGRILWSKSLGRGGILGGIHWGMAASSEHVYVPVSDQFIPYLLEYDDSPKPGLNKLDLFSGELIWHTPAFFNCEKILGWGFGCRDGLSAAITVIPGAVLAGGLDGVLRAYDDKTGNVIWQYDSKQDATDIAGNTGEGGTLDAAAVIATDGRLFFNSGYGGIMSVGGDAGNVFRVLKKKTE